MSPADDVSVAELGERPATQRFGADMDRGGNLARRTRHPPVGDQRDGVAETFADDRRRHLQHLRHPRPAGRALIADHDHVAGVDRPRLHRCESIRLVVEDARRSPVELAVDGELDDAPLRREVAAQNP